MNILIVHNQSIPVTEYGGVERIIWWLGKELVALGHAVSYLVPSPSRCPFAKIIHLDSGKSLVDQIPADIDFVHLCFQAEENMNKPYLMMYQYNYHPKETFDINTVFISQDHAKRNQSATYVYNGMDIEEYGKTNIDGQCDHLLFLGYAKRPEKNIKDCLSIARKTGNILSVIGGKNKWYRRRPWVKYEGFLGGERKHAIMRKSKALLFPVLWHEPFGIAIIEALYFGTPVIGSPYGSLSELITNDIGCVTKSLKEMISAVNNLSNYRRKRCHEYVCDQFTSKHMTQNYLKLYEKVLSGETLNRVLPVNGGNFSRGQLLELVS